MLQPDAVQAILSNTTHSGVQSSKLSHADITAVQPPRPYLTPGCQLTPAMSGAPESRAAATSPSQ